MTITKIFSLFFTMIKKDMINAADPFGINIKFIKNFFFWQTIADIGNCNSGNLEFFC
ncbi:Uncharacterised protein [Salmonella enterica subsp. enterica serovar Typhimurium str. DT104]|nr:Uncharacterised protein [Salmonella enterica subsp. enterica serovar Typhimurium str. DT104]